MRLNIVSSLVKNNFIASFQANSRKKKNGKNNNLSIIILAIVMVIYSFYLNFMLVLQYHTLGLDTSNYLKTVLCASAMLTFIFTILKFETTIFKVKDFELLESMPLTKTEIISSKIIYLYLFDLAETLIIVLPAIVFHLYYGGALIPALITILCVFFVPMFPLAIAGLLSYILTVITSRMKHKDIITTVLYFVLFIGMYVVISFLSSNTTSESISNTTSMISKAYPLGFFLNGAFSNNWLYLLAYIGLNVISAVLIVIFIALGYHKINTWLINNKIHEEYKVGKDIKSKSLDRVLLDKEWKMIIRKPMYFVNSYMGCVMSLLMCVMFAIMGKSLGSSGTTPEEIEEAKLMAQIFGVLGIGCGTMMFGICSSTIATISFEGKAYELLHTYPIEPKKVLRAKLVVSLIIPYISSIIFGTLCTVLIKPNVLGIIAAYVTPILASTFISLFGLLCNLRWYSFDWDNETQVLKHGKASMVAVFVSLGINMTIYIAACVLMLLGTNFAFGFMIAATLLLNVIIIPIYCKKAPKMLAKI